MRIFVRALLTVLALITLGTLIPRPLSSSAERASPQTTILILSNPIHTDIAIPLDAAIRARFGFVEAAGAPISHPDAAWLILGWGGRAFYLETPDWADLKPLPVFRALTVDSAVMHVALARASLAAAPDVRAIALDAEGYARLLDYIERSFTLKDGRPAPIPGAGYGQSDAFFEAEGWFNALVGCNTWTAAALREAGATTGWWTPLPQLLTLSLDLHKRER
ncbi:TIGR02117 family protein [Rhizobium sp. SG_E_25_P2]|uniref:TIGR02117 family protein n=1 Tax=Rhizobium sp. SG_E_25_P2 TaxID=2879942 RepID=UPI002475BFA1|nr:TIGR02117 family protein [Rhizobium sp. SG_E_25_P2]